MKSKFILITILLSLLLNITHDFVLYAETKDSCVNSIQLQQNNTPDSCCSKIEDLHNAFHFLAALLPLIHINFSSLKLFPFFTEGTPTLGQLYRSFKPPRL